MSDGGSCPRCGREAGWDDPTGLCSTCCSPRELVDDPGLSREDTDPETFPTGGAVGPRDPIELPSTARGAGGTPVDATDTYATRSRVEAGVGMGDEPDWTGGMPVVPGHVILGRLGVGGMGVVYRARQVALNRPVALKMIRDRATIGGDQLERFRIEAEAVARLRHPNIIQIYEVGLAAGVPYCSLELLEGGNLAERIGGAPQPARPSAELLASLARAIHAAHEAGIVHRDLKPQNVLFDRDGTPKVADFGLAKRLEVEDGLTVTDQIMGTPAYMAPEQALGKNREVGPPADVYALGAILYALLTGRPPIQGTTWRETLVMVVDQEPVSPSRLQPKVPRDLETIALKCLAKDPRRRYASALVLAEDLGRFLAGRPILARRVSLAERGWKWARRHPSAASLAALALALASAVGLGWAVALRDQAARREVAREVGRVEGLRRSIFAALLEARERIARDERVEEARVVLVRLDALLQAEPKLEDLREDVKAALGEALRLLEDHASRDSGRERLARFETLRDEALFLDALSVGQDSHGGVNLTRVAARDALSVFGTFDAGGKWSMGPVPVSFAQEGRQEVTSGCYLTLMVLAEATASPLPGEDARGQAVEALRLLDRASALRPSTRAYRARLAACLGRAGDAEAARRERAEADRMESAGAFDRLLLGQQLHREGDLAGALREFAAALQEEPDLFWAQCLSAICALNSSPSRPSEAWASLNSCLQRRPDYAWLYLLRGSASGQMGAREADLARKSEAEARFADAEADFRKALGMGLDDDLRYTLFMNRGVMKFQGERAVEALADFDSAIALDGARYNAFASKGLVLERLGRKAEAIRQLDLAIGRGPGLAAPYRERSRLRGEGDATPAQVVEALGDLDEAIRREPPRGRDAAVDHARRGRLLLRLDRHAEALAACDLALAIAPDLASAHRDRAASLLELGRFDEVLAACDAALAAGPPSAEMHELRGLARVGRNDFAGAVDDYARALALRPGRASTLLRRGRAYLFANSPELALRDFEEASRLDPGDPEAPGGRAAAKVRLRRHAEAVLDAEESLRRREPTRERLYDAARTYAQATSVANAEVVLRGRPALREFLTYEGRAAELLTLALDRTPADRREAFWREIVARDESLANLRRRPEIARKARPSPGVVR